MPRDKDLAERIAAIAEELFVPEREHDLAARPSIELSDFQSSEYSSGKSLRFAQAELIEGDQRKPGNSAFTADAW